MKSVINYCQQRLKNMQSSATNSSDHQQVNAALLSIRDAAPRDQDAAGPSAPQRHESRLLQRGNERSRLANLIAAQSDKQPLQALENLVRGNRQVAALASVISAQAGVDHLQEHTMADGSSAAATQSGPFIRTPLPGVEREEIQTSYHEPQYRILQATPKSKWWQRKSALQPAFATGRTKSEMLADRLLNALNAHPATGPESDPQRNVGASGKEPLLHQRLLTDVPFSIEAQNEPAPVGHADASSLERAPDDVAALVLSLEDLPHAEFITRIAAQNEDAATFLNFVSHGLLVKDSVKSVQLERYPYIDDDAYLREKIRDTGNPFVPTFIDGVERNFRSSSDGHDTWRIQTGDQWQSGQSQRDVLTHVLIQAMQHLQAERPTSAAMPVYPLVAYEVLADAIGVPVPQYLKDHETTILSTLTENQLADHERKNGILAQQQQHQVLRHNAQASMQQRFRDSDVTNDAQWRLSLSGYRRDLVSESVDAVIPLPSGPGNPALVKGMRDRLRTTHVRQEISARSHNGHMQDNLCWLRSSWLSAFASASPDQLAGSLLAISSAAGIKNYAEADAPVLHAIAQLYREDAFGFMRGTSSPAAAGQPVTPWADNLARAAHLGANRRLSTLFGNRFPWTNNSASIRNTPEAFLQRLQLEIATAFRPHADAQGKLDGSFMAEIQGLEHPGSPATSNLPVTLHRALNLPLLVVEHDGQSAQLRVAAPHGSDIAQHVEQLTQQAGDPQESIDTLLSAFSHRPILWLDKDHYSLHFPTGNSSQ